MAQRSSTPTTADSNKRKPVKVRLGFENVTTNSNKAKGTTPAAGSVGMTEATRRKLGY